MTILQNTDDEDVNKQDLYARYPICCRQCEPMVEVQLEQKNKLYSKPITKRNTATIISKKTVDYISIAYWLLFFTILLNQILIISRFEIRILYWLQDLLLIPSSVYLLRHKKQSVVKTPKFAPRSIIQVLLLVGWRLFLVNYGLLALFIMSFNQNSESRIRTGIIRYQNQLHSPKKTVKSPRKNADELITTLSMSSLAEEDSKPAKQSDSQVKNRFQTGSQAWKAKDWSSKSTISLNPSNKWNSPFSAGPLNPKITFGHNPNSIKWVTKPSTTYTPANKQSSESSLEEFRFKPQKFPSMVYLANLERYWIRVYISNQN